MMRSWKKYLAIFVVLLCAFSMSADVSFAATTKNNTALDEDDIRWRDFEFPDIINTAKNVFEKQNGDYKKMVFQLSRLTTMYECYVNDKPGIRTPEVTQGFQYYLAEYRKNLLPRYLKNMRGYRSIVNKKYKSDKSKYKAYSKIVKKIYDEIYVWQDLREGIKDSKQIDSITKFSYGLEYKCTLFYQDYKHRKYTFTRYGKYKKDHKKGLFTKHGTMVELVKINKKKYKYIDPWWDTFFYTYPVNTGAVWVKKK
jgi:hypothetical protein